MHEEQGACRVLIADDQVLYREALCELVRCWPEFAVVGEVSNGLEAVEFCEGNEVDMVLMDVRMPVMDGVTATKAITECNPSILVVVLTVEEKEECLFDAICNGAKGYILKDTPARQLHDRLRGVSVGEGALSGSVAAMLIKEFGRTRAGSVRCEAVAGGGDTGLTERELQVLRLVAQGYSNDEIGSTLYISAATVKKQLSAIMQKLHLDNRVQVAVYAAQNGLLRD